VDDAPRLIRRRLAEYLSDPASEHHDVARRFDALPVYADMGGTLFITPSLLVLSMKSDEIVLTEESAAEWKFIALVAATERFPELKPMLPARPDGEPDCAVCAGTGRLYGARCGSCFGLGWPALGSS